MTIASEANRSGPYACNGVATVFPYGFRIYDAAHIRVILTLPDGTETTLAFGTGYTVSGVGDSGGGAVETTDTYGAGHFITLILNVPFTQNVDLENQGAYYAETIERAIDLQTQMSLQLKEQVARAVVLPVTSSVSVEKLTSSVLSLAEIQPQMSTLAPIAEDIKTVAGISGAVVAAGGYANTATMAAAQATSKAAEAAASADAAKTWNPAGYSTTEEIEEMLGGYVPTGRRLRVGAGLLLDGVAGSDEDPVGGDFSQDRLLAVNLALKALGAELWQAGIDTTEAPISPAKLAAVIATLGGTVPKPTNSFIASGSYTPSPGTQYVLALLVGGGGGAGGKLSGSSYPPGGSGGNGGLGLVFARVKAGAMYSFAIGAGGTGGSAGTNNGNAGGTTSLTIDEVTYFATGGGGGAGSASSQGVSGTDGICSASCLIGGSSAGQLSIISGSSSYGDAGVGNPGNAGMAGTSGRITIVEFGS